MRRVVGFGELMVRISPVGSAAYGDSNVIQLHAGGSEANVLAKVGGLSPEISTLTAPSNCSYRRSVEIN